MHPPAYSHRLSGEKHVLADDCRLGEHVVAGLTLQMREWQRLLCIEKFVLDPLLGTGGPAVESVIYDIGASTVLRGEVFEPRVDEQGDHSN